MLKSESRVLDRRRLSEAWLKWHLIEWKRDLGEDKISALINNEVEADIELYLPKIRERFSKKWSGLHHTDSCNAKGLYCISLLLLYCKVH